MMDKIVDIQKRIQSKKQEEQLDRYRGKIETLQKVLQCSSCHLRCARCGLHLRGADSSQDYDSSLGCTFCETCKGEFEDFLSISRGKKRPDVFWHNKEWMNMWSTWLKHRQAIAGFMNSPEFKLLIKELDKPS